MPLPRASLVDDHTPGCYHVVSRCVRRAFLCGDAARARGERAAAGSETTDRKTWVRDLIHAAAQAYAVDVLAYAVMANHLHLVVRTDPHRVEAWTPGDIAARWAHAHPRCAPDGSPRAWTPEEIDEKARDAVWVATARLRLRSLSWFMKTIKERLARRANKADRCTGHFWEGRFKSIPLLDQAAVLAAMAYVDLNPVRAAITDRPEDSDYTSVQDRCRARQAARAATLVPGLAPHGPEDGLWIAPILRATVDPYADPATGIITLDQYLELVDATGRAVKNGKRGSIPAHLAPILERLNLDTDRWISLMHTGGLFHRASLGDLAARATEALRRKCRWLIDATAGLYRPPPAAA